MGKYRKAWAGRFSEQSHPLFESFNASIGFDHRLYKHDIALSIAHASMLGKCKIIPVTHARAIVKGLKQIEREIENGKFSFDAVDEDIHMAIERRLSEIAGPKVGGKLHTARSRNDQVATSLRMYVRDAIDGAIALIRALQKALVKRAKEHVNTIAPAYTHLQPAQPVPLAHWFLAYYEMFQRDVARFTDARKRVNVMPLGSAALAGTNFPIDRKTVAEELGFGAVSENSMDAVADRDFAVEFLFAVAMTASHLSRLAEEVIIFTSAEFSVMELPDALCTGSSIMPQKKNPDAPELIRGKSGRLNGHLVALLTTLKGLPLTYNKDLQEDKEPVFDAGEQIGAMLEIAAELIKKIRIDKKKMARRAEEGYMVAVDVADRLVMAGVPFREAHEIVGSLARRCLEKGVPFSGLPAAEAKEIDPRLARIDLKRMTAAASVDGKDVHGGAARKRIAARLKRIDRDMRQW